MAENETIITLKVEKASADKAIGDVKKDIQGAEKSTKKLNKETKKTPKLLKGVSNGFKLIGGALKAAGIGLVIALFAKLGQVLSKNQKVVDAFSSVMTTIEIVFKQVVTAIKDAYTNVAEAGDGFSALGKVMKGLMTIALTPIQLSFYGIKGAVLAAQLAWEKSFFGDDDPKTIKELNEKLTENKENIIEVGAKAAVAGKNVVDNFSEALSSVKEFGEGIIEEGKKISIENAKDEADRLVAFRNRVKLQEAALRGITLEYQTQAEQLRQIRDDEEKTIQDRIKANEDLGELLVKQGKEEKALAQDKVALIQAEIAAGDTSIERQVELINAKNEVVDIEERIVGFQSEQLLNANALRKEQEENLNQIKQIGKTAIELSKEEARVKLETQRKVIERTIKDEEERNAYLIEARREYTDTIEQIELESVQKIQAVKDEFLANERESEKQSEEERYLAERQKQRNRLEEELATLEATEEEKAKIRNKFDSITNKNAEEARKRDVENEKTLANQRVQLVAGATTAIVESLAEGSDLAKGFAAAEALFNTYVGITTALKAPTLAERIAGIAFATVAGFGAVQDILSTDSSGQNVTGSQTGGRGTVVRSGPRFDVVGDNQRVRDAEEAEEAPPTKTYVVSKDVTTQQELDREVTSNSRFI